MHLINTGAKRLASSCYMPDRINHPEHMVSFGEAYNICAKMIREESIESIESVDENKLYHECINPNG